MSKNPRRRRVDVNINQLDEIIESTREKTLDDQERQTLRDAIHALAAQLGPWRNSEKASKVLKALSGEASEMGPERPRPAGHGRNGAAALTGAERVRVPNQLEHGCPCPECLKGRVYLQEGNASPLVRFVGGPPIHATVYELQRSRCNLCGKVYTAEPPPGVGPEKYDETASSMVACCKYGNGIPYTAGRPRSRAGLEALQKDFGIPLPASTQWDLVQDAAEVLKPAQEELVRQAAQADVLHGDDTGMKVLEVPRSEEDVRTGVFTTGVVSTTDGGHPVALFFSGPQHAGENVKQVLQQRAAELPPPVLMGDASSRNTSKLQAETEVLVANCLAHGRRHFVDVLDNFPEECRYVLETLGQVYAFDDQARQQGPSPKDRLKFHQQNSGPVMKALRQWLDEQLKEKRTEPNSGLGNAMKYLLTHWNPLTLFLRHPGAPLDNNVCERALKKAVLHRKNALFYRTMNGAEVGDLFMSLIHTCGLNQVNPFDYLTELQRHAVELRADPAGWMPWNYRTALAKVAPS